MSKLDAAPVGECWVVVYWADFEDAEVDSVWSSEPQAIERCDQIGRRSCSLYRAVMDGGESDYQPWTGRP